MSKTMTVTHDGTTFTMTGRVWTGTYPLAELPKWLEFYRRQKDLHPKAGNSYDAAIEALENLTRELHV